MIILSRSPRYFEGELKKRYLEFVNVCAKLVQDVQFDVKSKIISIIQDMLTRFPEQEKLLLTTLVNRVGDPDRKLATKASHLLRQLVHTHPRMKLVVVREVRNIIDCFTLLKMVPSPLRPLCSCRDSGGRRLIWILTSPPGHRTLLKVEQVLYRKNLADRARYYCVCYLNQTELSRKDSELANKLVTIYLDLFQVEWRPPSAAVYL